MNARKPQLNLLEKAIALFSPQWALERAGYRELFRSYEAGEVNRFNDDWTPINADAENTDKVQRDLIKARARYLENNSDIAAAAVGGIVRNVVGTGIKPQARTPNEELNAQIESLWSRWTRPENCDVTGQQSFYELQAMILRRQIYDGEIMVKKIISRRKQGVPFQLQVLLTDLLDSNLLTAPGSQNIIRSGIELDSNLKPLAYWIEKKSPDGYILYDPDRVPARNIIHMWQRRRPDQIRGMSYLTPIITRIKDTGDYLDAETVAAKIAACFSVFITSNIGAPGAGRFAKKDAEGKPLQRVRPGMITHLQPGESVETANPSRSVTNAKDFVGVQQRLAGAGLGLSYELMSRDFTKSSFSAARQGMLEDRKTFEPIQQYMIGHFCDVVYKEWMDAAVLSGQLDIPDYWARREEYTAVAWVPPGWSWIDPEKEVNADIKAIQSGGKTLSQWCAERGYDWREQLAQMALEKKTAEALGLILPVHTPESVQAAESNHDDKNTDKGGEADDGDEQTESESE